MFCDPPQTSVTVVFQVNGINVEPCTHEEVVSIAVALFPPTLLRLPCAVPPCVVNLSRTFPLPSPLVSSFSLLLTAVPRLHLQHVNVIAAGGFWRECEGGTGGQAGAAFPQQSEGSDSREMHSRDVILSDLLLRVTSSPCTFNL